MKNLSIKFMGFLVVTLFAVSQASATTSNSWMTESNEWYSNSPYATEEAKADYTFKDLKYDENTELTFNLYIDNEVAYEIADDGTDFVAEDQMLISYMMGESEVTSEENATVAYADYADEDMYYDDYFAEMISFYPYDEFFYDETDEFIAYEDESNELLSYVPYEPIAFAADWEEWENVETDESSDKEAQPTHWGK